MRGRGFTATVLVLLAAASAGGAPHEELQIEHRRFQPGAEVFRGDFDAAETFWVEGNPERVWVEGGRLILDGNVEDEPSVTVFVDREFTGNLCFSYVAEIRASDTARGFPEPRDVNNLNTFLYYRDPAGRDLKETREERRDAAYSHYHAMGGYVVTFLNGHIAERREAKRSGAVISIPPNTGRVRLRENPGFGLRAEKFSEKSEQGRKYLLQFVYVDGELLFFIDGQFQLGFVASPEKRSDRGYFAFRTFGTRMAVDSFRVQHVKEVSLP